MASVFSHPAVPAAIAIALGPHRVPPGLAAVACAASILPDVDSLGFAAGIPYGNPLGHRGITHSLPVALLVALASTAFARKLGSSAAMTFAVVFASTASHGLLDAMTTGGLGVAFFAPFSNRRHFLPWRVILVSPIGITPFLSDWGLRVLKSEAVFVWLPAAVLAGAGAALRRIAKFG
jgi:inner membrane protein